MLETLIQIIPVLLGVALLLLPLYLFQVIMKQGTSKHTRHPARIKIDQSTWLIVAALIAMLLIQVSASNSKNALTAKREDFIPIPPPQVIGTTGSTIVQLSIKNASPQDMKIFFKGTEKKSVEIPRCETCQIYSTPPKSCPKVGVTQTYTLQPGEYEVDVEFSGNTRPYRGRWPLATGTQYSECFSITYGTPNKDDRQIW
ncbi:hypothetical protein ACKFKG_03150 [Phormidesmis sp. 146-35]